jgi:2-C-methyl-D-erythritol 4-phosphate cytidylyltransferase
MVAWSIAALRAAQGVRSIVVARPPGQVHDLGGDDIVIVDGGATRAQSVAIALEAVGTELVAIHDAARPLVTPELIEGVVATLAADPDADGAVAATPVTDTIKRASPHSTGRLKDAPHLDGENPSISIDETVDRGRLWAAQTPQVFRVEALRRALEADPAQIEAVTDEAMSIEAAGGRVLIHPASPENLKVTSCSSPSAQLSRTQTSAAAKQA